MTHALRPMTTGELLDRAFSLYRNNFALFAGIAVLPALLKLVVEFVQLQYMRTTTVQIFGMNRTVASVGGMTILFNLVYLFGVILASAATVYAVSMVHLEKPASIGESYKAISPYFLRLAGIFFLLILIAVGIAIPLVIAPAIAGGAMGSFALMLLGMLVGGLVVLHLYVCLSLASAACVVEKTKILASLNRSMALTKGARGRIWLILLLYFVFTLAFGIAIGIVMAVVGSVSHSPFLATVIGLIAEFMIGTFIAPILTIPLVLVYYDQRIRKEAFDLQVMMEALGQSGPEQAIGTAPIG